MTGEALTLDTLERWAAFGADWQVVEISTHRVVVDLCNCMGERVERRESDQPDVIDYLRKAPSDLDLGQPGLGEAD